MIREKKRNRATKKHKRRRGSGELLDQLAVDEDGDDNTQEDEGEDEEGQKYLFYDIEARQEDCRHIPNLLIVQDEKGCETGEGEGEDCVEKFGEWLLDGTHQGAIVIAHNSRSYDSYFLCEYFYKKCLLPKLILNGAKIMSMELEAAEIKFRDSLTELFTNAPESLAQNIWSHRIEERLLSTFLSSKGHATLRWATSVG